MDKDTFLKSVSTIDGETFHKTLETNRDWLHDLRDRAWEEIAEREELIDIVIKLGFDPTHHEFQMPVIFLYHYMIFVKKHGLPMPKFDVKYMSFDRITALIEGGYEDESCIICNFEWRNEQDLYELTARGISMECDADDGPYHGLCDRVHSETVSMLNYVSYAREGEDLPWQIAEKENISPMEARKIFAKRITKKALGIAE